MNIVLYSRETNALEKLKKDVKSVIKRHSYTTEIFCCKNKKELEKSVSKEKSLIDLIIFDTGDEAEDKVEKDIAIASSLREENYWNDIAFISDAKELVFDAFNATPVNYILRNNETEKKLEKTIVRSMEAMKQRKSNIYSICFAGVTKNILVEDILYFESIGRLIVVHCIGNNIFKYYTPIGKLEKLFDGKGFIRINQSFIIAKGKVKEKKYNQVTLIDGTMLSVGRMYKKNLKEL